MVPLKFVGDPFSISGYSEHIRELMLSLLEKGADLSLEYVRQDPTALPGDYIEKLKPLINKDNKSNVSVYVSVPTLIKKKSGKVVAVCAFETDGLPKSWVERLNETSDLVIVPSRFNLETFSRAGVKVPIEVVPEGFDPDIYRPTGPKFDLGLPSDTFKFVSMSSWILRKGWERLLVAYLTEFSLTDKVALILKVHGPTSDPGFLERVRASIKSVKSALGFTDWQGHLLRPSAPIYLLAKPLSPAQLAGLYRYSDAFVLATRGEGWSRGALEAAACASPVITTNWSGHLDFLSFDNSYLVNYDLTPCISEPGHPFIYSGEQSWADIKIADLRQTMRLVFSTPPDKRLLATGDVNPKFTWQNCASKFMDAIDKHFGAANA